MNASIASRRAQGRDLRPMLAVLMEAPLRDARLLYEPKYDGIRAIVEVEPRPGRASVRIWSRLGNDKTAQFPELVQALERFGRTRRAPLVLDGEIVALDSRGRPTGFQQLQGRIHLTGGGPLDAARPQHSVAFIAFDLLRDGEQDLRRVPLAARRVRLERLFDQASLPWLRLGESVPGDGRALYRQALEQGWEGLIAKRADSLYESGRRSTAWRKLKIVRRQEFVVGGWTEPRRSRPYFGALLLGVYEGDALQYAGHTGGGFTHAELARVDQLLRKHETRACPFKTRPRTNERPHWVEPRLVAEVKFTEWTGEGRLRNPIYLGLRDDIRPETVRREPVGEPGEAPLSRPKAAFSQASAPSFPLSPALTGLLTQLEEIEERRQGGELVLPAGHRLPVGNLDKVFWPAQGITKGELMRYYLRVSPFLLPAVEDRPLVMRRFPNGVKGKAFYQQRAPEEVPTGVRVAALPEHEVPSRLVGGSLLTLLYMTQLAVISQDPWFSRVQSLEFADHVAFDLDPMPGATFAQVRDVARWIHDELERLGIPGVPKTSGVTGLHIYIPLPPRTSYEAGRLFCQIIATLVARRHPKVATVARAIADRGRRVYIDYLQNIQGKTLATAYSARASAFAGVSTPLTWAEIEAGVDPREFTLRTIWARLPSVGDLWTALRTSPGADLAAVLQDHGRSLEDSTKARRHPTFEGGA